MHKSKEHKFKKTVTKTTKEVSSDAATEVLPKVIKKEAIVIDIPVEEELVEAVDKVEVDDVAAVEEELESDEAEIDEDEIDPFRDKWEA